MGAVKDTATKVLKTVAKTTKNVVQGAVALARAVRGDEERERSSRGRTTRRREERDRERTREPATRGAEPGEDEIREQEVTGADEDTASDVDLDELWGIGEARADKLREMGLTTVDKVAEASDDQLKQISGIGDSTAQEIKDSARELAG